MDSGELEGRRKYLAGRDGELFSLLWLLDQLRLFSLVLPILGFRATRLLSWRAYGVVDRKRRGSLEVLARSPPLRRPLHSELKLLWDSGQSKSKRIQSSSPSL